MTKDSEAGTFEELKGEVEELRAANDDLILKVSELEEREVKGELERGKL